MENYELLISEAKKAMGKAYSPYSGFSVGAALLTKSGKVYYGCNIENAAFTPTVCAERTAIFKAISEGEKDFLAIAVVGSKTGVINELCPPCGVCRQVLKEFCKSDFKIVLNDGSKTIIKTLNEMLPFGFGAQNL